MERPKNSARGTYDLLPEDSLKWQFVENLIEKIFLNSGFGQIRTPVFEHTEIFRRSVGETSDIVGKEMYTFRDKSDRSLTLRPEGTAGVVRAFLSNSLDRKVKPVKLWYLGNMFRYERSQVGRYRQFTQAGCEIFGSNSPEIEFEAIKIALNLFKNLGLENLELEINSVGDFDSRLVYTKILREFLETNKNNICEDCQKRTETNPLRALDCKIPADINLYKQAPSMLEYLSQKSREHLDKLISLFENFSVKYKLNSNLVRGLDYYTETVFEIKTQDLKLAGQNTICAGGRYNNLVSIFGGENTPAFGWAIGMERLLSIIPESIFNSEKYNKTRVFIINELNNFQEVYRLAEILREKYNFIVELDYDNKSESKQFELAKKLDSQIIINLTPEKIILRDNKKNNSEKLFFDSTENLLNYLKF